MQLESYRIHLKLMIDGVPSLPFSAQAVSSDTFLALAQSCATRLHRLGEVSTLRYHDFFARKSPY